MEIMNSGVFNYVPYFCSAELTVLLDSPSEKYSALQHL
jgi:hypothetical protein